MTVQLIIQVGKTLVTGGRLGVYWPAVTGGQSLYIHSKVMVTANATWRWTIRWAAMMRALLVSVRDGLLAEHLGLSVDELRAEIAERNSILRAVDGVRVAGRSLRKFTTLMVSAMPDRSPRTT